MRESDGYIPTPKITGALREAFKQAGKKLGAEFKPTADDQEVLHGCTWRCQGTGTPLLALRIPAS